MTPKIAALLSALILAFFLGSCGGNSSDKAERGDDTIAAGDSVDSDDDTTIIDDDSASTDDTLDDALDDDSAASDDTVDDDADDAADDTSDDTADDSEESSLNIIEEERLGADWSCNDARSCIRDYLLFPALASIWARPITEKELNTEFHDIYYGDTEVFTEPIPAQELRDIVIDNLNIRGMISGIDRRPLRVVTTGRAQFDNFNQRELLFKDPLVGTFKGVLYLPNTSGPYPGLVAIHGHGEDAWSFLWSFDGEEFPARGYAILSLTMRANDGDAYEDRITRMLLLDGFTFMGIRAYESMLGLKYLKYIPEVVHDRIGLIGHSGGSAVNNLTCRMGVGFKALVTDNADQYYDDRDDGLLIDANVPALYPYSMLIADFTDAPIPVRVEPYGFTDGFNGLFDFLDANLMN